MLKHRSQILCVWFLAWDMVLTALAWVGAFTLFGAEYGPMLLAPRL